MHPGSIRPISLQRGWFAALIAMTCACATAQEVPTSLHFKPADHVLGDVHPYFSDGECFLYYLKPAPHDVSLVHCRDLINWTPAPLIHQKEAEDAWMRPYYVLGVLRDDIADVYRSFYGYRAGQIVSSLSTDLMHWSCGPKEISIPSADYYERRRDPYVFWIDETKSYGCVMTTWIKGMPQDQGGATSLATSKDLKTWLDHGPIIYPKNIGEPECPQMFKLANHWYLLASIYDRAVGRPVYWTSDSPMGPWTSQAKALEGKDLCAAQVASNGSSMILLGWVPLKPSQPGDQAWGGHLALPREVFALPSNELGVKLAGPIKNMLGSLRHVDLADIDNPPVDTSVLLEGDCNRVSLRFNWQVHDASDAFTIRCEPLGSIEIDGKQIRILDLSGQLWSEQVINLNSGSNIPVHLIIEEDIVEVFIDDKNSLVARLPAAAGQLKLAFAKRAGEPKLTSIKAANW